LGAIVDLRPYFEERQGKHNGRGDLAGVFGMFLGFTNVVAQPADLADPERLLATIALQNARHKHRGIAQASALRMLAGVVTGQWMRPEKQTHFYQKHVPISGGVSNVNMNKSWA